MKAYYNIYLTIDGIRVWMNKYTAKQSYSFSDNLCSASWKSVTDTASCKLVFNDRNVAELSEIISKLIEAQQSFPPKDVGFEALNEDETKTIFRGVLDLGKLSIESAKLPGSVSITAKSPMDGLDVKPNVNLALYPATVQEVVERCIWEATSTHSVEWRCSVGSRQIEVPFVVTDEDSDTWRNKIDTLLTEMGGYTLTFDHQSGKFYVMKVNDADKPFSDVPVNYHVQTKLKSSTTKFAKDGVVVSYGNVKKSEKQYVYMHDISLENKAPLFPKGDEIKAGQYYPYDSDVTKTFEEYEGGLLDYGQLIGNTRKANEHIGIYYVDPESTKVEIVASDMNGNSVEDWYDNLSFISPNGGFTYPAGGEFYPKKAWLSFRNKTDKSINITKFHISGDTYYSDAEYSVVMPIDCTDPEEYSAKYISKTDTAREFANFLMNLKRFGSDTSTWTERWEDHNLGDKVKLHHKGGNTIDVVIVRKDSVIYGDELWAKVIAVSIDGWNFEQPSVVQGSVQSPSLLDPYENAKKNGYTGSREQWEKRNDIYYAWSSSHSEFIPAGDKGWSTDWKDITTNKPAGNPFLWARVGEDGEPFLMQGIKGDPGDRIYQWRLSKYADYEGMGADLSNFKADGNLVFYNGQLLFDGNTSWIGQDFPRPVVDEDYPYLWERYSDDKGVTWSEAYLVQSLMPRTIRIISSRPSFDKSARGVVKADQTVTLSVVTNGIGDKAVHWTTSGGTLSSAEGRLVTLVIPKGFLENSVTVSVVSAGVSDTLTLRANTVGGTEPKKLPTVNRDEGQEFATELEDGDVLIAGDYCIAIIDGYTVPCRYDGTSFVEVEGSEDNASQIMGGIIEEALSMSDTVKTGKFIYAFIKNLVATNAFIDNLGTVNLTLSLGGVIKSEGYTPGGNKKGFYLNSDGTFECYDGIFKGTLDGAKGRFTGQLQTITLQTELGGESSYSVGNFSTTSSMTSSLYTVQNNLGFDITNKSFKAGGTLSGLGTIASMNVSQVYNEFRNKIYTYKPFLGSKQYKWETARITWLVITFTNTSGSTAQYVIRKVRREIKWTGENASPNYPSISQITSIPDILSQDDYFIEDYSPSQPPGINDPDNKESVWDSVGPARNESLSVSGLVVYDNTQERMYIRNLPSSAPTESHRVWRDSNGYLRIV